MVDFYQRHISAWMDGTEGLEDGEYRVYDVICNLIYLNGGPIVLHESGIAGRCNQHVLRFRQNLKKLIAKTKIIIRDDGKITNLRVESELQKIASRRRSQSSNPSATPAQPQGGRAGVRRGSGEGSANKSLKTNKSTPLDDHLEKRREDTLPNGKAKSGLVMHDPPLDAEADLFRRGREVLGASSGGMIKKLLIAKGGNVALARAALEQASQRNDAREYVGGMIRNLKEGDRPRNGYVAVLQNLRQRQQAEREQQGGFSYDENGNSPIIDHEPFADPGRLRH